MFSNVHYKEVNHKYRITECKFVVSGIYQKYGENEHKTSVKRISFEEDSSNSFLQKFKNR